MYLMIQNPGEASVEAFTVLGLSSADEPCDGVDSDLIIGRFGSGSKHAINVLLRESINPVIYCGKNKLEFYVKNKRWDSTSYGQVCCNNKELGFSVSYGRHDWGDIAMALREFVSNAIDRTIREVGTFRDDKLVVDIVEKPRARAGFTRVFVPLTVEVQRFYSELGKRFLHFSEPESIRDTVLTKRSRNFSESRVAMIYRKGVFVREARGVESLFDYNFSNELALDECRNVDDWRVSEAAAVALRRAEPGIIAKVFNALINGDSVWESTLHEAYLSIDNIYNTAEREAARVAWATAWESVAGDAVLAEKVDHGINYLAQRVARKGYKVLSISGAWFKAGVANGARSVYNIVSGFEQRGIEITEPTEGAVDALDVVWEWIEKASMTNGLDKPPIKGYNKLCDAESDLLGFYDDGVIYINNEGQDNVRVTVLDELTHYVTGSTDCSRDFQEFLMRLVVKLGNDTLRS